MSKKSNYRNQSKNQRTIYDPFVFVITGLFPPEQKADVPQPSSEIAPKMTKLFRKLLVNDNEALSIAVHNGGYNINQYLKEDISATFGLMAISAVKKTANDESMPSALPIDSSNIETRIIGDVSRLEANENAKTLKSFVIPCALVGKQADFDMSHPDGLWTEDFIQPWDDEETWGEINTLVAEAFDVQEFTCFISIEEDMVEQVEDIQNEILKGVLLASEPSLEEMTAGMNEQSKGKINAYVDFLRGLLRTEEGPDEFIADADEVVNAFRFCEDCGAPKYPKSAIIGAVIEHDTPQRAFEVLVEMEEHNGNDEESESE